MTADKELWCGRWIARHAIRVPALPIAAKPPRRRHASMVLELALMFVLATLLPREKKRK